MSIEYFKFEEFINIILKIKFKICDFYFYMIY